ncbi:DUF1460 domain-containing protein [Xenorhabdus japonica]|uniref:DUF1460 domain-containing protein n=1 Tax=Xenorhabdus japonica TaxID=53341 RepID=A0A1I5BFE0_9GAMM|nr:DUF1460 domain-containing protein [Xenorhabdus japonica]SFN73221.1 Protein of unknown function [Xenorhabdus japonica]
MMKSPLLALLAFSLISCSSNDQPGYPIVMSDNAIEKINNIIERDIKPNTTLNQGELIDHVSASFLGTPYLADTLIGSPDQQEALVINVDAVDCFTYLDYVVALTKSSDISSFLNSLINTRYKNSNVSYYNRKHFFTDWYAVSPQNAIDVTSTLSPDAITIEKLLNQKSDGGEYIKGLGVTPRMITYIPGKAINQKVIDNMQDGDLAGVYSPISGLDVSHTGIVIKKDNQVLYRNASSLSKNNKVVDISFIEYMHSKPGVIVLRATK